MSVVPVTTIRGTSLLVGALEGLRKKITLGQLVEAQTRLGELLTAIQIDPAPFTVDDFEGPEHATRTDHQVLTGIAQLLEENLAELKHLRAAVGQQAGVSSVELTVDSKAIVKPTVKVYDPDPDVASAKAMELFDAAIIKYGDHARSAA